MKHGVRWLKARCCFCGAEYSYPEGVYKPQTCNSFECTRKAVRDPECLSKVGGPHASNLDKTLP
jgi:hypothetical protein